jgi:RimJ/RimL family protein N-acetyltransferase
MSEKLIKLFMGTNSPMIVSSPYLSGCLTEHWDVYGFGDWSIFSKAHSRNIGFAGLHYIKNVPEVNIGYAFSRAYWGQGFATETCHEII